MRKNKLANFIGSLSTSILFLFPGIQALGKEVKSEIINKLNSHLPLEKALKRYRTSHLVEIEVAKIVKSALLGKSITYNGKIHLGPGVFRWENFNPEHTLLVFDGRQIMSVVYPLTKETPAQVNKTKISKKTRNQILVSALTSKDGFIKGFRILEEKNLEGDTWLYRLAPKSGDLTVDDLQLKVQKNLIKEISYKDDIGNQISMQFSATQFFSKKNNKLFLTIAPHGSQVSNL